MFRANSVPTLMCVYVSRFSIATVVQSIMITLLKFFPAVMLTYLRLTDIYLKTPNSYPQAHQLLAFLLKFRLYKL